MLIIIIMLANSYDKGFLGTGGYRTIGSKFSKAFAGTRKCATQPAACAIQPRMHAHVW